MSAEYDAVTGRFESPSEFDQGTFQLFAFSPEMLMAVEIRELQIASPLLAFSLMAIRSPGRVLELLNMCSHGVA